MLYPKWIEITGGEVNIANYLKAIDSKGKVNLALDFCKFG